jgi:hypothetical protein
MPLPVLSPATFRHCACLLVTTPTMALGLNAVAGVVTGNFLALCLFVGDNTNKGVGR